MIADLPQLRKLSGLTRAADVRRWLKHWQIADAAVYESIDAALERQVVPGIPPGMESAEDLRQYQELRGRKPRGHYSRPDPKPRRTPAWADLDAINLIYGDARRLTAETGVTHSVDHVIPLCGKLVTGLHVETNLRVIPLDQNIRKNNRWTDE